jgi:hypothetical protein
MSPPAEPKSEPIVEYDKNSERISVYESCVVIERSDTGSLRSMVKTTGKNIIPIDNIQEVKDDSNILLTLIHPDRNTSWLGFDLSQVELPENEDVRSKIVAEIRKRSDTIRTDKASSDQQRTKHYQLESGNDSLTITNKNVIIERSGLSSSLSLLDKTGEKRIPIEEITGIEKDGNKIHFNQKGYNSVESTQTNDLNTITIGFERDVSKCASQVKKVIEERKGTLSDDDNPTSKEDPLNKISQLKELYENNAITKEEFKSKKKELLEDI